MKSRKQAGIVPACLLWCILCVQVVFAKVDSAHVGHVDTAVAPFKALGRIMTDLNPASTVIAKTDIRRLDYRSFPEVLQRSTGAYPRFTGGFGQHNAVSFMGEDPAGHVMSVNGRHIFDPWSWRFHLEQVSVEGVEQIEILHGTDAIGLGGGMGLHAINLQQIVYDTKTPITRLWYAQGGGEFLATDVTLSQNIAPTVNATVGIRRSGAIGRFDQTDFDVWNVRTALRWVAAPRLHMQMSYDLASLNSDLWGGVEGDTIESVTEPTAIPVYQNLRDLTRRHDVQVTAVYLPKPDSSTLIQGSVYGTASSLRRLRDSTVQFLFPDKGEDLLVRGQTLGAQLRIQQEFGLLTLRGGTSLDVLRNDASAAADAVETARLQAWAHGTIPISETFSVRSAVRLLQDDQGSSAGGGISMHWHASPASTYVFDLSTAPRYAGPSERTIDGQRPLPERHLLVRALASFRADGYRFTVEAFYRQISDVMSGSVLRSDDSTDVLPAPRTVHRGRASLVGLLLCSDGRWKDVEIRSNVRLVSTASSEVTASIAMPLLSGTITAAYVYETATNSVRIGATLGMQSSMRGPGYSPLTWTFTESAVTQAFTTNGIDAHVSASVGNADVRLAMENILGVPWFSVAGYPEISRNFRLSVHWSFFD